jgi:hypothetical protein
MRLGKPKSMRVEIGPIECTLENEMQIGESRVVIQLYIPQNRYADIQKRNPEFEHHLKNHLFFDLAGIQQGLKVHVEFARFFIVHGHD